MNILRRIILSLKGTAGYSARVVAGVSLVLMTFSIGAGTGFLSRPAIEHDYGTEILVRTGVDVRKDVADENAPTVFKVDDKYIAARQELALAMGPNGIQMVQLPDGVMDLVGSGAIYVAVINIFEYERGFAAETTFILPGLDRPVSLMMPGVKKFEVTIERIEYVEPPEEDVDDF